MKKIMRNKPKNYLIKCEICDCVFTYELEDVKISKDFTFLQKVRCPDCGFDNDHERRIKRDNIIIKPGD